MDANPPEDGFEPRRMRSIADTKRSTDDKMIAGVCSGLAKYLNIDPVIVRIILVALTFAGFAGLIVYLAGWLFLPAEGEAKSIAAQWFKLDDNEEQVRVVALIIAGVVAIFVGTGLTDGYWNGPFGWFGIAALIVVYAWIIRPAQRRKERQRQPDVPVPAAGGEDSTQLLPPIEPAAAKTPWSPALTYLTLSTVFITLGCVALWANAHEPVEWTAYAVAALGVIGVGLLVGSWWGNAGLLIPIGGLIALALATSTLLPSARIGHDVFPVDANTVSSEYERGIGQLELNLNDVADRGALAGRTITVSVGIGQTRVVVPAEVNVEVRSTLKAGEIKVFDRRVDGTQNTLNYPADTPAAAKLTLDISQSIGNIEVIKQ